MSKRKIYTFQNKNCLESLKTNGFIRGEIQHSEFYNDPMLQGTFKPAYDFMYTQCVDKIPNFSGDWPIWATPRRPGRSYKNHPDDVLIVALIPRERVLEHRRDVWDCIINGGPVCMTEQEWDNWDDSLDPLTTWHRLFDFTTRNAWVGETVHKELCVDRIYQHEILSVTNLS